MNRQIVKDSRKRYRSFSRYLKETFKEKVYKVCVDAGFSCPNRDGTKGLGGCIYCNSSSFSGNRFTAGPVEEQIEKGRQFVKKRYGAEKFIVYFQPNTNTYAPAEELKKNYDVIKKFPGAVGISVGTRPDCVKGEILSLLSGYTSSYDVWIEYGLQSMHDKTLEVINRGHGLNDFIKAFRLTRNFSNIKICVHVIAGLPGENFGDMLQTAEFLGKLKIDGIKIHPLHVVKNTLLSRMYEKGEYSPMELKECAAVIVDFLERLHPSTVIHRIGADCPDEILLAPQWIADKHKLIKQVELIMREKETYQGRLCSNG
ncbi:MAG: TIGR01212 family radical SAM protein [Elusimicrobiota bacterium]